jgi:16S rRNA (uracil1498-N3)-methyltransferase
MDNRYFVETPITADRATLTGPEAHHLVHVMRAVLGELVTLFDGRGDQFSAVVERIGRADVTLTILGRESVVRELPFSLVLGVALPKGDRQKWLVEKTVELGVTRLVSLRTQRGVAQPVEQAIVRLRRAVVEASKQCGRNRLMRIDEPQDWPEFAAAAANDDNAGSIRLFAHPGAASTAHDVLAASPNADRNVFLAVGPEGGFADEEAATATAAGWRTVTLGPRILRVETAALLLAALAAQR